MARLKERIWNFARDEEGATMVEYALMVALIAVVCIISVTLLGNNADATFNEAAVAIGEAGG